LACKAEGWELSKIAMECRQRWPFKRFTTIKIRYALKIYMGYEKHRVNFEDNARGLGELSSPFSTSSSEADNEEENEHMTPIGKEYFEKKHQNYQ
jgi:hypothetical protein